MEISHAEFRQLSIRVAEQGPRITQCEKISAQIAEETREQGLQINEIYTLLVKNGYAKAVENNAKAIKRIGLGLIGIAMTLAVFIALILGKDGLGLIRMMGV